MSERTAFPRPTVLKGNKDVYPGRCPLCGKLISHVYPETGTGIRYADCRSGHKLRLRKEDTPQKTAG